MIKGSVPQEDITVLNKDVPHNKVSKYVRQTGKRARKCMLFVRDFSVPLLVTDSFTRKKNSKDEA
jgi:hypothetical protein